MRLGCPNWIPRITLKAVVIAISAPRLDQPPVAAWDPCGVEHALANLHLPRAERRAIGHRQPGAADMTVRKARHLAADVRLTSPVDGTIREEPSDRKA